MNTNYETITLAGGCFWCLEAVYDEVKGVISVDSGYSNGNVANPTYKAVCTGLTGHAEVVKIVYDPAVISTRDILNVFFAIHDPTTLNRQGADVGTQYRSGIYYHTPEQKEIAENLIKELTAQKIFDNPIVTEVDAIKDFYIAEDYHQEYYVNNKFQPYCMAVISPKVNKFRKHYLELLKKQPA
ncbi:MAG: peptide-methionine (S)-S-oxide reductase MsrA [Anaerolineales bacterium]|nr:peptide-methionine (S)-S-oxide reductase MsrA [Anaerolineales bacterium]MBX3036593.1 peptide-methionine (S)-S-oxide reductase MsrA [Anaerolineales bacterium]